MTLLQYVIDLIVYGSVLLIDLSILFCVIRLIVRRSQHRILVAFDTAGRPVIDVLTDQAVRTYRRLGGLRILNEPQRMGLVIGLLVLLRSLLAVASAAGH